MGALAHKKAAVVPIEIARRRLRPELNVAPRAALRRKSTALSLMLVFASAAVLIAAVSGLRFAFQYVERGHYWAAVLIPWMILLPAFALMLLFLARRKRPPIRLVSRRSSPVLPLASLPPRRRSRR